MSDKPKFDPSQPFEEAAKPKFDPGKPFDIADQPSKEKISLPAPDFAATGKQALAFVSGDGGQIGEGIPVLGPLARSAGEHFRAGVDYLRNGGEKTYGSLLKGIQTENETRQRKFAEENPKTDIARKVVGGLGGALMIPIPGAGAQGAITGPLARIAGITGISAADTAARGGSADDVKRAATFGGGAQTAIELIPGVGRVVAPITKPIAEGVEALGGRISELGAIRATKAAVGNLIKNQKMIGGEAKMGSVGADMLDNGVVKFGDNAGAISRRASEASKAAWSKVEQTFKAADEAGVGVDGSQVAQKIRAEAGKIKNVPKNESRIAELEKEAAYYEAKGKMSLKEAQSYKNEYDWKNVDPLKDVLGKNGNNLMNRAIGETIKDTVKTSGLPGADEFVQSYQQAGSFGAVSKAAKATSEQQARNRGPFSLTDYMAGGAGGVAAAAITGRKEDAGMAGLAIAAANGLMRTRGNAALGVSLNRLGEVLASKPAQLGKFYGVLEKAAQSGSASLAATHETLMQTEPAYRKAIEVAPPPPTEFKKQGPMPIAPKNAIQRKIRELGE